MQKSKLCLAVVSALACLAGPPLLAGAAAAPAPAEVDGLVAILKSDAGQKEKADACRELARMGAKEAVPALAALLADEKLSHMARYGLETIPDPSVDKALLDALAQLQGRPLVGVISSLGVRHCAAAVKPLTARLRDADADVAEAAARALGSIATAAAVQALEGALPNVPANQKLAFCEGLLRCAEALTAQGKDRQAMAIYDRLRALEAPHQVRSAALRGAILLRGDRGVPLLVETLHTPDFSLFAAAMRISLELRGTGRLGQDAQATRDNVTLALADELPKLPAERQVLLAQTLGNGRNARALPALSQAARKGEPAVRVAALRALGELGSPAALPALLELIGDSDRAVAQAAQEAITGLQGKGADAAVLELLACPEPDLRLTALDLIARRRMASAVPRLLKAASDADAAVRVSALKKLGGLAGLDQLPALLDLLAKAKRAEDLEAAEDALNTLCVKAAAPAACAEKLAAAFPQAETAQKCALLRVLAAVGGASALKCVRGAVNDPAPEVRGAALRALASWSTPEAAPDLLELARAAGDATEKAICLRGYLGFAGRSETPADQRLAMCREAAVLAQNADEKKLLLAALGGIQSLDAITFIQPYLNDDATREEAARATVGIAEKFLQGAEAAKSAPKLVEPLEAAARATQNADLATRAKGLLEQARQKTSGK